MATKKHAVDMENNKDFRTATATEDNQNSTSQVPPFTVRVYPIQNPRNKLVGMASITIANSFAVKGFQIYDSKNGLFVKDPERRYHKNGTELKDSVFFPITKEARDILHNQILDSYELVLEQQERQYPQQKGELEEVLEDDLPFDTSYQSNPLPTNEDSLTMTM
jgi:DNA-binding cell septation regulator SpoVG